MTSIFKVKTLHLPLYTIFIYSSVNALYFKKIFSMVISVTFLISDMFGSYDSSFVDDRLRKLLV